MTNTLNRALVNVDRGTNMHLFFMQLSHDIFLHYAFATANFGGVLFQNRRYSREILMWV